MRDEKRRCRRQAEEMRVGQKVRCRRQTEEMRESWTEGTVRCRRQAEKLRELDRR